MYSLYTTVFVVCIAVFKLPEGLGVKPSSCFLNPLTHSNYVQKSQLYTIGLYIQFTSQF